MAKTSGLPDVMGPLNVPAQPGDVDVPPNDMAGVAPEFSQGRPPKDPLDVVPAKGGKK